MKLYVHKINYIVRSFSTIKKKMHPSLIAVCQMTSTNDKEKNLDAVKRLTQKAVEQNAKFVFFPEATDYLVEKMEELGTLSEKLDGPLMTTYKSLARDKRVWLSMGGFHERVEDDAGNVKLHNSHIIIDDKGDIKAIYRKLHLFDVSIPEKNLHLRESDFTQKGQDLVNPIETPIGKLGLSICYDLRFPEISTILRKNDADILTFPSAFTQSTGEAHWSVLLRARAIENQCYVIAAAQYGKHNAKRISYGHAMVVDPWGKIIAECDPYNLYKATDESVAIATIDPNLIAKIRAEMPVLEHRRDDIYSLNVVNQCFPIANCNYKFAHIDIPPTTVFYRSKHSYAFTNIRCVVPGHVLVSSIRPAQRIGDLNHEEVSDLFNTVVKVQKVMEKVHGSDSTTICVQDGKNAGQTIPHVHCHILPRQPNDFKNNDDIYHQLAKHDSPENQQPLRSLAEQETEAAMLGKYFI